MYLQLKLKKLILKFKKYILYANCSHKVFNLVLLENLIGHIGDLWKRDIVKKFMTDVLFTDK